jgi:hypothetical protein
VSRVSRGETWHASHRTHAYQRAVQGGRSHAAVTTAIALLNVALVGLAALAVRRPALLPVICLAVTASLVLLWSRLRG